MANRYRGEIDARLDGKPHTLCLTLGALAELEDQMCTWLPTDGTSPDRMDALVWALTELVLGAPVVASPDLDSLSGVNEWGI